MADHDDMNLEPLRSTIARTAESARKAARNSAQILNLVGAKKAKASPVSTLVLRAAKNSTEILRLMQAAQGQPDPIATIIDMLLVIDERLAAMDSKLDRILTARPSAARSNG